MTWLFPVVRATGGFITATLIQLLIQRRITTLSNQYLVKRGQPLPNTDVETGVEPGYTRKKAQMDARTWLLLCLLLIGLVSIGCGICWLRDMLDVLVLFRIRHRIPDLLVGSA